jgi:hypothetical protein
MCGSSLSIQYVFSGIHRLTVLLLSATASIAAASWVMPARMTHCIFFF